MAEIRKGYKETEIGIIPEDWEVKKLGEIVDFYNGKAHERELAINGEFIVVNSKFISTEGKVKKYTNNPIFPLIENDIVMVMSDVPNGRAIAKTYLIERNNKYTLNQRICCFRDAIGNVEFLNYLINRNKYYLKFDDGVKQTNLRKQDVLSLPVQIPPLKEQEKIAEILSSTDNHIEDLDRLIEDYELLKKGMMQKLLTEGIGHTEFKDTEIGRIPKEWEVRSLGECFEFFSGYSAPRSELSDKGVLYLHYGDIHLSTKSYIDTDEDSKWLPRFKIKREKKGTFLDHGDIVFADASEDYEGVGKSVVIYRGSQRIVSGLHTIVAKDISCNLGISYKRYFLNAHFVRKQFKRLATGAKVYGIAKGNIGKIVFAIPPIDEQEIIGETLANIENQISLLKKNKDQINILKQALMDRLLTGKIRVV